MEDATRPPVEPVPEAPAPESPASEAPPEAPFRRLDPGVVRWWRWSGVLRWTGTGLMMGGVGCFLLRGEDVPWRIALAVVPVPAVLFSLLFGVIMPPIMYRHWSYRVDERELRLRRGVFVRTDTLVRHSRLQYVEVRRSLLERWMGLASVVIHTAASEASSLAIPGLRAEDAERLRAWLISLIDDDRL